jgi:capsular exopolysaccharide synthesis family protein
MKIPLIKNKANAVREDTRKDTIGEKRSFAATEAYKRLRTNVLFSFSDDKKCRVIGVTSAMAHEGKSTTSINLAYDMKKVGKKVLLIDADMRLSRVAKVLEINRSPGLSNFLTVDNNGDHLLQHSEMLDNLTVITCGDLPPNPTELLSSKRMGALVDTLKKAFDYIIIDLPPVTEVADPLIVSKLIDGMIVVVRQDYADRNLLSDAVQQLRYNEVKILGFVMTCAQHESKYYKYKYKKYYKKNYHHGYRYGYGYANSYNAEQNSEPMDELSIKADEE